MTRQGDIAISDDLRRELALVLPRVDVVTDVRCRAIVAGHEVDLDEGIRRAVEMINKCTAPVLRGAHHVTLEASHELVTLAQRARLRWLVGSGDRLAGSDPVALTATFDAAMRADTLVWLGRADADASPIVERLRAKPRSGLHVEDDLDTVLKLRAAMRDAETTDPTAAAICGATHVTVIAPHEIDPRVLSQWHHLAADEQRRTRVDVLHLPALDDANARGVREVLTWMTGTAPSRGAIDFATDPPTPASTRGPCELLLDFDIASDPPEGVTRIAIGPPSALESQQPAPAVRIITPGLCAGLAARVMRFDGAVLWLCDESNEAPPDPTVDLIKRLAEAVTPQS